MSPINLSNSFDSVLGGVITENAHNIPRRTPPHRLSRSLWRNILEGIIRASLALSSCPLWHSDFEEDVI